jgi:hypothetical protein
MDEKPILDYANPSQNKKKNWLARFMESPACTRFCFGLVGVGGFVPLMLLLRGGDHTPLWEQWVTVAVFTPAGIILEWIAITGRTTFRRRGPGRFDLF